MIKYNYILIFSLVLGLFACQEGNRGKELGEKVSSELQVDHCNIWVENPEIARERLSDIGFAAVPDSLSEVHTGQGTSGRYFHFLNGYLELIFVYDQEEFEENNEKNKGLDFTQRANHKKNGASPFSIALKVKDYDTDKIPFEKVTYHQDWMENNANIYSAKESKTNLKEPSIFVVYPGIESERFETLADLKNIPDEYAFARAFYKHPNGAEKITNIVITSLGVDLKTKTIKALNEIDGLTIENGKAHLMELYFDNNAQGKSFDLRPELPLIVYL